MRNSKTLKITAAAALVLGGIGASAVMPTAVAHAASMQTEPIYRIYNPNSGEHFYTESTAELDNLTKLGWTFEGVAWYDATATSSWIDASGKTVHPAPVYRVYNPNSGEHYFTTSEYERDQVVAKGWKDEGIGFYSAQSTDTISKSELAPDSISVYVLFNPNAKNAGSHIYTTSLYEYQTLVSKGWIGNSTTTPAFAAFSQ